MKTFKQEVLTIAKKLSTMDISKTIKEVRENINSNNNVEIGRKFDGKSLFFSATNETFNHFYGVLLLNNEVENGKVSDVMFKGATTFSDEEKSVYLHGNKILMYAFNEIRKEIDFLPISYQLLLNPYASLRTYNQEPIKLADTNFDYSLFNELGSAFKNTKLIKNVKTTFLASGKKLKSFSVNQILQLTKKIEDEVTGYGFDGYSPEMAKLSIKRKEGGMSDVDKVTDFFCCYFFLKDSIATMMNTFFSALIGHDLSIISEENIINITNDFGNLIKKGRSFLLTDFDLRVAPRVGNLALMSYEIKKSNATFKDFGFVCSTTHSFLGDSGGTISCSIQLVDEDLNRFFPYLR